MPPRLPGFPYPVRQVAAWGAKIAEALAQMHRHTPPLVHRDVKPENIMLLPDGVTIRLIDFGSARDLGPSPKDRGVARTKVYTEGYAPPEQILPVVIAAVVPVVVGAVEGVGGPRALCVVTRKRPLGRRVPVHLLVVSFQVRLSLEGLRLAAGFETDVEVP